MCMTEAITARMGSDLVRRLDARALAEKRTRSQLLRDATERYLSEQGPTQNPWKPKSAMGRRLWKLRSDFVQAGGELLSQDAIRAEVAQRRGKRG
jgi:hypothetical protein